MPVFLLKKKLNIAFFVILPSNLGSSLECDTYGKRIGGATGR